MDDRIELFSAPVLRRAVRFAVVLFVLFLVATTAASIFMGSGEALARIALVAPGDGLLFVGIWLVALATRLVRWHAFAAALGLKVPALRLALYYIAGYAFTVTPGRVGEAFRLWALRTVDGVPYRRSTPMLIGDRLSDLCCVMILCFVGVTGMVGIDGLFYQTIGAALIVLLVITQPRVLAAMIKAGYAMIGRRGRRMMASFLRIVRLMRRLLDVRRTGPTLAVALIGWAAEAVLLILIAGALGAALDLRHAMFIVGFSMLVGAVPFLPGGLGGVEVAMVTLLASVGLEIETAMASVVIFRATTLWLAVALGVAFLPLVLKLESRGARPVPATAS